MGRQRRLAGSTKTSIVLEAHLSGKIRRWATALELESFSEALREIIDRAPLEPDGILLHGSTKRQDQIHFAVVEIERELERIRAKGGRSGDLVRAAFELVRDYLTQAS